MPDQPRRAQIFTNGQWATIIGGLVMAAVSVTAFAFTTFEQKSDLRDWLSGIDRRLDRIENSLK